MCFLHEVGVRRERSPAFSVTISWKSPLLLLNLVLVPKPSRQLALSLMLPEGREGSPLCWAGDSRASPLGEGRVGL